MAIRVNILETITEDGEMVVLKYKISVISEVIARFLKHLQAESTEKLVVPTEEYWRQLKLAISEFIDT